MVVGEPQRAFYGNQFGNTFPVFTHYRVPLWVPDVGGPIDFMLVDIWVEMARPALESTATVATLLDEYALVAPWDVSTR